jgi:hypothetical protein
MEDVLRKPVELIEEDLDVVAGGFFDINNFDSNQGVQALIQNNNFDSNQGNQGVVVGIVAS